jgi:hypothetical protein
MRWGTADGVRDLFGHHVTDLRMARRQVVHRYRSPKDWLDFQRTKYGPTLATFAALDPENQQRFADELLQQMTQANTATDGTLRVPAAYLEVVATRV